MKTKLILVSAFFFVAVLALAFTASATIPHIMNFQGKATDKSGTPLNGSYNLTFRVYDTETGGTTKWIETQTNIPISNGIFKVRLGTVTPLNLPFDEAYWISIEINTDGEMAPRTRLASIPYAYKADKAESLTVDPVVPFYKKGFDIEFTDFNSIKISPGVMDVGGKMFTTTAYSTTLQLSYLDNPANRDWIYGSKTTNSFAYVYAYDNNGQIGFKFSTELPDISDHLGNTAKMPFLYQRYPDNSEGVYHRYIGKVYINDVGNVVTTDSQTDGVPAGTVTAWAMDNPPSGWLLCDGSAVSRTTYANLFSVIGTKYGIGDGVTTFNLPNLKGRIPVGFDSAQNEFKIIGQTGGAKTHTHSGIRHAHGFSGSTSHVDGNYAEDGGGGGSTSYTSSHSHGCYGTTESSGADDASLSSSMAPYIILNYIIKI